MKFVSLLKEMLSKSSAESVGEKFVDDFNSGKVSKMSDTGGGRNIGIYDYGNYIIKRVKSNRKLDKENVGLLASKVGIFPRVVVPKALVTLSDGSQGIVMDKATGKSAEKLSDAEIEDIPDDHWKNFEKDVRMLSSKGVQTDLTKRSNMFYDSSKGFQFIDIEGIAIDGDPTNKFFDKDGEERYHSFERYPVFSKKFTTAKDMFTNIPKH